MEKLLAGLQLRVEGRLEKGAQNEAMVGATRPMEEKKVQCRVPSDCIQICHGCQVNKCTAGLCVCGC